MAENIDWQAKHADAEMHAENQLEQAASRNSVNRDFYGAALAAKRQARHDGLHPETDEYGELHYTQVQGITAACHGREDVTAILIIQQSLLRRLETLYVLGSTCILLLGYIAYRVS
jgi:hypothetical protein